MPSSCALRPIAAVAAVTAVLALGCGDGELVVPPGAPGVLQVLRGTGQSGAVGQPLAESLVVRVLDLRGQPVAGQPVVFAPTADSGALSPDTVPTDAAGRAAAQWVLGPRAGPQRVRILVPAATELPVGALVVATAGAAGPRLVRSVRGDGQSGFPGVLLPDSLVVAVTDSFGNPVPGAVVRWTPSGSGRVTDSLTVSDTAGLAGVRWALGAEVGDQILTAALLGGLGAPAVFTATAK